MKRITVSLLLGLTFLGLGVVTVQAQAIVMKDVACGFLAPGGTGTGQAVFTNNANGNATFVCHGELPDGSPKPSPALIFNFANTGSACPTPAGLTERWTQVITPGGKATLTCHVNPSSTP